MNDFFYQCEYIFLYFQNILYLVLTKMILSVCIKKKGFRFITNKHLYLCIKVMIEIFLKKMTVISVGKTLNLPLIKLLFPGLMYFHLIDWAWNLSLSSDRLQGINEIICLSLFKA